MKVLDHQILDCDGRRCGNVDDLELEGGHGETASIVGGGRRVRVPWDEVTEIESHVVLRKTAEQLGLGRGDDRLRPWIERIPGAHR